MILYKIGIIIYRAKFKNTHVPTYTHVPILYMSIIVIMSTVKFNAVLVVLEIYIHKYY